MNNISFIYGYIDLNATICYFVYNIIFIFLLRYRMGAWFSSRSQPLSFNTNEYELHHGYKSPPKKNKNNNITRKNNRGAFAKLLNNTINGVTIVPQERLDYASYRKQTNTKQTNTKKSNQLKRIFEHLLK